MAKEETSLKHSKTICQPEKGNRHKEIFEKKRHVPTSLIHDIMFGPGTVVFCFVKLE